VRERERERGGGAELKARRIIMSGICRIKRVLTIVYNTQNYECWVSGLLSMVRNSAY
jgi:hypothetical protein